MNEINTKEERIWTVYIHTVPKEISGYEHNKHYVGITSRDPKIRWANGNGYKPSGHYASYFWNAIQKYGWSNILHKILYTNLTRDEANNFEQLLISVLRSNNKDYGYNIQNGGQTSKMTEEIKRKISKANTGKKVSKETKKKLSESLKGRSLSEEHIINRTISQTGLKRSKETCEKISNAVSRSVVCLNTKVIYKSLTEASLQCNTSIAHISQCCNKQRISSGKDDQGNSLYWMWFDEYQHIYGENMSLKSLLTYCKQFFKAGAPSKQVRCINSGIMFSSITEANKITGVGITAISRCCRGIRKSAGKDENGNKLYWEFVD